MAATQDVFFERRYFQSARKWASENGFTHAMSMLTIYDSFVHSGSILPFLRARFPEPTPAAGGRETEWIRQYVEVRHAWLRDHSNPELRPTIYRTRDLMREITRGNWNLSQLPISANGTKVDDRPTTAVLELAEMVLPAASGPPPADYVWQGLGKGEFLRRNRPRLALVKHKPFPYQRRNSIHRSTRSEPEIKQNSVRSQRHRTVRRHSQEAVGFDI